jgi:hypothetical protein
MKVKLLADIALPGGFIIESETSVEKLMLRSFVAYGRPNGIWIAGYGDGPTKGSYSIVITHKGPIEP